LDEVRAAELRPVLFIWMTSAVVPETRLSLSIDNRFH
jgi:hypothetical protein